MSSYGTTNEIGAIPNPPPARQGAQPQSSSTGLTAESFQRFFTSPPGILRAVELVSLSFI